MNPRAEALDLPPPPSPRGNYQPLRRHGPLIFVSGMLPLWGEELRYKGRVGGDVSLDEARQAASLCALNALSCLSKELGSLDQVKAVLKVTGFVRSVAGFESQPQVVDGASQTFVDALGEAGRHARAAVGVAELPMGSPVEVDMIVAVSSET